MTLAHPTTAIQNAIHRIQSANYLVVLSGAGLSTASGIPDFRSQDTGVWNKFNPLEVASLTAFRYHPQKFFDWLIPLYERILNARPNPAHVYLARLESAGRLKAIITQNIDRLHNLGGSQNVIEVHGSLSTMSCPHCKQKFSAQLFHELLLSRRMLPHCSSCGVILKPDITLFEEELPEPAWRAAVHHTEACDVFWVIGSSLEVYPAASLPRLARDSGANIIINNFSPTPFDHFADILLPFDITETVPYIVESILGKPE